MIMKIHTVMLQFGNVLSKLGFGNQRIAIEAAQGRYKK